MEPLLKKMLNAAGISAIKYVHQDSLGSTSTMSASTGNAISSISYFLFGLTGTGSFNTTLLCIVRWTTSAWVRKR